MGSRDFWEMRLKDFFLKWRFHQRAKEREAEWRATLARMQTVALVNVHLDRRHRITDVRKFWRFPWEEEAPAEREGLDVGQLMKMKEFL